MVIPYTRTTRFSLLPIANVNQPYQVIARWQYGITPIGFSNLSMCESIVLRMKKYIVNF